MSWLLCDYGEVLSLPQPKEDLRALEEEAGRFGPEFWSDYWRFRPEYDCGSTTVRDYWAAVLGRQPSAIRLGRLVERDVAGWIHPNSATLAACSRAADRGLQLAVLSNAPHEVADALDSVGWLAEFVPRLFSCRLGSLKPEAAIYVAALKLLDAAPDAVNFFDDRSENVSGALRQGLRAQHFTDPLQIDSVTAT